MFSAKDYIRSHLVNFRGFKTKKKIIVIESDDWGSVRMPSNYVYKKLLSSGIPVDRSIYCKYDQLESTSDLELLIEILQEVTNDQGNSPIITANFVLANPDFNKIKNTDFSEYSYETILETYSKVNGSEKVPLIIAKGISEKAFIPQFHGRDHVNVPHWLSMIKTNKYFKIAFEYGMWGLSTDVFPEMRKSVQATYDSNDIDYTGNSIVEGLNLFEKIFAFPSVSFIANNFIWSENLNSILAERGVLHLQGMKYQIMPLGENGKRRLKRHFSGEKNQFGMTYGVRNCSFEPTVCGDTISGTLNQVSVAFLHMKPAIITTHRVNYSGGMCIKNRDNNLRNLKQLLLKIVKKWPDVVFMSSNQLFKEFV